MKRQSVKKKFHNWLDLYINKWETPHIITNVNKWGPHLGIFLNEAAEHQRQEKELGSRWREETDHHLLRMVLMLISCLSVATMKAKDWAWLSAKSWEKVTVNLELLHPAKLSFQNESKMEIFSDEQRLSLPPIDSYQRTF